ncbi:MAG TPA: hypothetical protein VK206_23690, partial [Anaerolineales bacterium]|nr:hypothetical protein [Anaerolineales bacterium]
WHRDAKYLAIASAIWGVGMNVDMALLPAIFILPALWLVYRPPVHLKSLFIAIGFVLIVWSPYLRFEVGRGLTDIRSQVFLQNIFPANFRDTWCDRSIPLRELGSTSNPVPLGFAEPQTYQGPNPVRAALVLTKEISGKLIYNFQDAASYAAIRIAFLVAVLGSIILLNVTGYIPETNEIPWVEPFWKDWTTRLALGLILIGVLTNEFIIVHILGIQGGLDFSTIVRLRTIEKLLSLGGACILAGKWTTTLIDRLLRRAGIQIQSREHANQMRVLVLSLAIPWFILLLVAEPGKPERFWWLWPLQAIFLAAFILWIMPRLRIPRPLIYLTLIMTLMIIWWNPFLLNRLNAWRQTGWAGTDAPAVQAVNYVASDIEAEGKTQAAIGYHVFIYQFMAAYNITNPEYKAGMDFDLLFKYPHGITNTDQCAEGFLPSDKYLIVQTQPQDGQGTPRLYFDVPLDANFRLMRQFGTYQVFKRQ